MRCYPEAVVTGVTALATAISDALAPEDAEVLAALLTQLGDTLASLAALKERRAACCEAQEKG